MLLPASLISDHSLWCGPITLPALCSRLCSPAPFELMSATVSCSPTDIPQVAIVTKIDEICPEITDNLQNVYKVKYMKEKVC